MRNSFWNRRIPSVFGLLFLAITVGIFSWAGRNMTGFRSRAAAGAVPQNILISNVTDSAFTVSYTTDDKTSGLLVFGSTAQLVQVAQDSREGIGLSPSMHQVHYVTVDKLNPNTKYYFGIVSGGENFLNDTKPYEVTTGKSIASSGANQQDITGSVNLPDGSIPLEGIVYISAASQSSQLLSGFLKQDGSYFLPIGSMRTKDLSSLFELKPSTILEMTILGVNGKSEVKFLASASNPLPQVVLTKNYDFSPLRSSSFAGQAGQGGVEVASESGVLSPSASTGAFPRFSPATSSDMVNEPAILTPKHDEKFSDEQPKFSGTGTPNTSVEITIESAQVIQTSVRTDSFGNWEYRPDTALAPGNHVITIITRDANGILKTIKQSFTVYAAGSQFTEPSVSPVFGATVTPASNAVSPTATTTLTPSPTEVVTPTIQVMPTIAQNSPTITAQVTSPPIPASGNYSLFIAGFISVIFIAGGLVLFLL